jgi:hypothetical protein
MDGHYLRLRRDYPLHQSSQGLERFPLLLIILMSVVNTSNTRDNVTKATFGVIRGDPGPR